MKKAMIKPVFQKALIIVFIFAVILLSAGFYFSKKLLTIYEDNQSVIVKDRSQKEIFILPNKNGYFNRYLDQIPKNFKEILLKKEDQYFYYHFGFNPWSLSQATFGRLGLGSRRASSTITQQLVKILLEQESERNIKNKFVESLYSLALETFQSKEKILNMYVNSVYFGNQAQGLKEASRLYFGIDPELLTDGQILQLLATISSPTTDNPAENKNESIAMSLADYLEIDDKKIKIVKPSTIKENIKNNTDSSDLAFEIKPYLNKDIKDYDLTIDGDLSEKIREIVSRNINLLKEKDATDAAVVVIKLPENELLSIIGSPDPLSLEEGYKINMADEPRPIGSTVKPFIYAKAFEKGLRPYTLVDDKEYKYITAIGFPLYPKNFDYKYRGIVSLHYALSNSLNVPAVKVLEYVGLDNFYNFLQNDFSFRPVQNLQNYQLGIALGSLEMSLLNLTKYFTMFPNNGTLKELKIYKNDNQLNGKKIIDEKYIQLINKIINDRKTGIEQFGFKSDLNLFQDNYALKTGTSKDFKDSWVIGFTPDFLVGVWVGNPDNSPTDQVSGQIGAGSIWSETMTLLLNSVYNKKTPLKFDSIQEFYNDGNVEYGFKNDDYEKTKNILINSDSSLILNPHDGDYFILEDNTEIALKAKENVKWFLNSEFLGEGENIIFAPKKTGQYKIMARNNSNKEEIVVIFLGD